MVRWDEFREIIWDNVGNHQLVDWEMISPKAKLMEDLKYDSVAIMGLLSDIEEKWGIDFTDLEDFGDRFNVCGKIFEGIQILTGERGEQSGQKKPEKEQGKIK